MMTMIAGISAIKFFKSSDIITVYENIEALARSESDGFGPMCSQTGNPGTYTMKWCKNCSGSFGKYDMDVVAFCSE